MTKTEREVTLGPVSMIPAGEGRNYEVAGLRVAVFRTRAGQVFATQANCPHKNGPLADGLVGGGVVICPLHAWKYDLATGEPLMGSCGLKTYAVRLSELGQVILTIPISPVEPHSTGSGSA